MNTGTKEIVYFTPPWPWFDGHSMLMPQDDVNCLLELVAKCRRSEKHSARIVEVGSFVGQAACAIAGSAIPCRVICVDAWQPNRTDCDTISLRVSGATNFYYEGFLRNTLPFPNIRNIKMQSVDAAKLFADGSLDMVFIDAGHEYEEVVSDISAWLPKVRSGGILCGHDFNQFAGVRLAVEELVPDYRRGGPEIWWKQIA